MLVTKVDDVSSLENATFASPSEQVNGRTGLGLKLEFGKCTGSFFWWTFLFLPPSLRSSVVSPFFRLVRRRSRQAELSLFLE